MAVNLLACLLARAFSPSEATAIWVELVAQRKKDVEENSDDSQFQSLATRMACRQDLSRNELAKWDASARAWLLSADEVKKFEATQFKLIVKDLGMFASSVGGTYASILDVWTTAMRSLQDLIDGMPQRITKGALLLGISAWHIYPDLHVVGPTVYVRFNDSLVNPGGIITIGLSASENDTGAKWSLSLSHLRYYGDPVTVSMPAEVDSSRITMEQLHLVALGSVIGSWGICGATAQDGAEFFIALVDCLGGQDSISSASDLWWLSPLWTAAKNFLSSSQGTQRDEASHLIAYGRRNGQNFLDEEEHAREPIFGLANPLVLAAMSTKVYDVEDGDEELYIEDLRRLANQCGLSHDECIIKYWHKASRRYEYATAVPLSRKSQKRSREGTEQAALFHMRWVQSESLGSLHIPSGEECHHFDPVDIESFADMKSFMDAESSADIKSFANMEAFADSELYALLASCEFVNTQPYISWHNAPQIFLKHSRQGTVVVREISSIVNNEETADLSPDHPSTDENEATDVVDFQMIACNAKKNVALFQVTNVEVQKSSSLKVFDVIEVLQSGNIKARKIKDFLIRRRHDFVSFQRPKFQEVVLRSKSFFDWEGGFQDCAESFRKIKRSLVALAKATRVYDQLPGATVSMNVIKRPLHLARWAARDERGLVSEFACIAMFESGSLDIEPRALSSVIPTKFACIAMFETGSLDIEPRALSSVMAMSSGNSIYVANGLVQDPSDGFFESHSITRILGNLGRPGVVMLVPPQVPRIVSRDPNSWRLINHHRFNGEIIDAFTDTSLHLSFTDYEVPLSVPLGAIDADAVMLESLISVYDREKWIADLDILGSLAANESRFYSALHGGVPELESQTFRGEKPTISMDFATKQMVSIDNWDELLDPPEMLRTSQVGVIRAYNNWQARLATMSVCVQMKYQTAVLAKRTLSEHCAKSRFEADEADEAATQIIII